MFDKMTPRERLLAKVVALLVPLFLLGWLGVNLTNRYLAARATIDRLQGQISTEENRKLEALLAQQRRLYYRDRSAPFDRQLQVTYAQWLTDLITKRAGMSLPAVTPQPNPTPGIYRGQRTAPVYEQYTFTANRMVGDIGQLLTVLQGFEELDLLHRISSLKVQPQTTGGGAGQPSTRTGKLVIDMTIEVLAMVDADNTRELTQRRRAVQAENAEWIRQISSRNIFGMANNPPSLAARNLRFTAETKPATEVPEGEAVTTSDADDAATAKVSLLLDGEDIDEHDELTFEVVSSDIETYTFAPEGRRRARFEAEQIPVGNYSLEVRVTDNGFPQKSAQRTFTISVDPPPAPRVTERPPPPAPPFRFAQTAYVVGSYEVGGVAKCVIEIKPLQREYHLAEGESFELDKRTWVIRSIESREVVIQVEDELLTFKMGRTLDQPDFRFRLKPVDPATTATGLDDDQAIDDEGDDDHNRGDTQRDQDQGD